MASSHWEKKGELMESRYVHDHSIGTRDEAWVLGVREVFLWEQPLIENYLGFWVECLEQSTSHICGQFRLVSNSSINVWILSIKGTTIRLHSQVLQHGRTMALIRGTMTSVDGKTVYATAEHHKVNVPMTEENRSVRIPWDDDQDRERELEAKESKL
jgi:hypothetical protein